MGLEKISAVKKAKGLRTEQIHEMSGVPVGTINKILNGETKNPTYETVLALSRALGIKLSELEDEESPRLDLIRIPVLGTVRCGMPLFAEQNIIGEDLVDPNDVRGGEYFFLKIAGDSMTGSRIFPGDKALIRRQEMVENGEVAVVLVNQDDATLKRVKFVDDKVILYPDNPKYQPKVYGSDEVKILGKVVKVQFSL